VTEQKTPGRDVPPGTQFKTNHQKAMTMNQLINRFRRVIRSKALVTDERGLSTVEYVIILVLIAAAAVGTWTTLGGTIKAKIGTAQSEIDSKVKL
jgi:Flp pilus assembly pilin Flp